MPFSITELQAGNFIFNDWEKYALERSYPRKWMNEIENHSYYDNYLKTYVERDVRLIKNIMNLDTFQSLIKFQQFAGNQKNILIYGGKENQVRENLQIIGFDQIAAM